jgi:hypothetical protein
MKKRAKAARHAEPPVAEKPAAPSYWMRAEALLERHGIWIAIVFVIIGTGRICANYTNFSHTFDEPAHIACGMQWLDKHTYTSEPLHPPLTRVMTALLPRLTGSHTANQPSMWDEGLAILFAKGEEEPTLTLARLGILPFFWITCWVTFACTRWISGSAAAAAIAVFIVTMTPAVLAHSGVATTDMGLTAMLLAAIYMGWRWIEEPVRWRAAAFGAFTGLALIAKFSSIPFLLSIVLVALLMWMWFERPAAGAVMQMIAARAVQVLVAVLIAAIVIWAGYRFSFRGIPAPEFFKGLADVRKYNTNGHLTYLLGRANTVGWPHFYLVALAVKTPLAVLALGLSGFVLFFSRKRFGSRGWIVPSIIVGILTFASLFTQIKIGTRHILPVFVALAIAGGCAAIWIPRHVKQQALAQAAIALLLVSVAISSAMAHPDYLAYFNFLAGDKPEGYLVDSDLDWGQDTKRLSLKLRELGAKEVYFNQFAPGNLEKEYGFPVIHPLDINGPQIGWNAVSLTPLKLGLWNDTRYIYDPGSKTWPDQLYNPERVGSSYILFYRAK